MKRWHRSLVVLFVVLGVCALARASSTASLTVTGAETQRLDQSWDIGPFLVTIHVSNYEFSEAVYYGQYSTPASVASQIAGAFTRDYLQNGLCANVSASGTVVVFKLRGGASFGALSISGPVSSFQLTGSGFASYNWSPPGNSGSTVNTTVYMSGGTDAGTYYDQGTLTVRVSGAEASVPWTEGSTVSGLATELASAINTATAGYVSASASGSKVTLTSLNGGPAADVTVTGTATDTDTTGFFTSPSFSIATTNLSGGSATEGTLLYGFSIPEQNGYAGNGNLLSVTDSVMGQWNYGYDNLNRLTSGQAVLNTASGVANPYANANGFVQGGWSYDAFGNRTSESWGWNGTGTPSITVPGSSTANYTPATNQLTTGTAGIYQYDAAGNVTWDGANQYRYDAEGRLCAVMDTWGAKTGYIYNAAGIRVARGSLAHLTCDFNPADPYNASTNTGFNGFTATASWVLGPGGEQLTEYAVSGSAGNYTSTWKHSNVFANGSLLATYVGNETDFALNDWLGTKRVEVSTTGCVKSYFSMPYGNNLDTQTAGPCPYDATEHHFTGKERDAESGNDYFGARYYASSMGRFLSPDWSAKIMPIPYASLGDPQSLNLYAYMHNNPLAGVDPDGHCGFDLQCII